MHNFKFKPGDHVIWRTRNGDITKGIIRAAKSDLFTDRYVVITESAYKREITLPEQYITLSVS